MKSKSTLKEKLLIGFLVVLILGVSYYLLFYKPYQADLTNLAMKSSDLDNQQTVALANVESMKTMQEELDAILAQPADKITEIAKFDNAKTVMTELETILSNSLEYRVNFTNPVKESNGLVRRSVKVSFSAQNYEAAKAMLKSLTGCHWRCLLESVNVDCGTGEGENEVVVQANIIFYESENVE